MNPLIDGKRLLRNRETLQIPKIYSSSDYLNLDSIDRYVGEDDDLFSPTADQCEETPFRHNLKRRENRVNYNQMDFYRDASLICFQRQSKKSTSKSVSPSHLEDPQIPSKSLRTPNPIDRTPSLSTSSERDGSSSDDDEVTKKRFRIAPVKIDGEQDGLEFVAGLDDCIAKLKEMITYPLQFPEFYQKIRISPPRGVLFHGPPGTGKTLVARKLVEYCKSLNRPVSFYVRNGGDLLSKYIGEAEKSIRLLFEEARKSAPSIIFFDEIDAIAPARSAKNDQSHISVVATLLAEMDGLVDRGQIVVIGATNRVQSVDPALRRPGRFDREFYFPMPGKEARCAILKSHTKTWKLPEDVCSTVAEITSGFSGSDIRGLCLEAATKAFNRSVAAGDGATDELSVTIFDFLDALREITPSERRVGGSSISLAGDKHSKILIGNFVTQVIAKLSHLLTKTPTTPANSLATVLDGGVDCIVGSGNSFCIFKPRLLVGGESGMQVEVILQQALGFLENISIHNLDLLQLFAEEAGSPESVLCRLLAEAKSRTPSIVYLPRIDFWWERVSAAMQDLFLRFLDSLHPCDPILIVASSEGDLVDFELLVDPLKSIFQGAIYAISKEDISFDTRKKYFSTTLQRIRNFLPLNEGSRVDLERLNAVFRDSLLAIGSRNQLDSQELGTMFPDIFTRIANCEFTDCSQFLFVFEEACVRTIRQRTLCKNLVSAMISRIAQQDLKSLSSSGASTRQSSLHPGIRSGGSLIDQFSGRLASATERCTLDQLEKIRVYIEQGCLIRKENFNISGIENYIKSNC